jgi:hypothetical protein
MDDDHRERREACLGRQDLADTRDPGGARRQKEGNVGAEREGDLAERRLRHRAREELRQGAEHGSGVARAPAEPGARGHALRQRDARSSRPPGALQEGAGRAVGEVARVGRDVGVVPRDFEGDSGCLAERDLQAVCKRPLRIEGQEQALEEVVAVGAAADDAEPEVQLGGRGEAEAYFDASTKRMRRS